MATAHINLEDVNGMVAANFVFEGGFDKTSHAHQHAMLIQRWMDENMERESDPEVETVETSEGGETD